MADLLFQRGCADGKAFLVVLRNGIFLLFVHKNALAVALDIVDDRVPFDGTAQEHALILAVLGDITDTVFDGIGAGANTNLLALHKNFAAFHGVCAVDDAHQLGTPGADQTGKAQNLPAVQRKGNIAVAVACQMLHAQHFFADLRFAGGVAFLHLTPRHHGDQLRTVNFGNVLGCHILSVAHNGNAVRNDKQLLQTVGDKDDGNAAGFQIPNNAEQRADLVGGQGCGRLVHNKDLDVLADRLGDLNDLLHSRGQAAHLLRRIQRNAHLVKQFLRAAFTVLDIHKDAGGRLFAKKDVLGGADTGNQGKFLIDHADSLLLGGGRCQGRKALAVDRDGAAVRRNGTGQGFYQGGFSCTVFPDQRVDFPLTHIKRNMVNGNHTGIGFHNVLDAEDCFFRHGNLSFLRTASPPKSDAVDFCLLFRLLT